MVKSGDPEAVAALQIAHATMVPHPDPVAAGKVTVAEFDVLPEAGTENVTTVRAYPFPETSVPDVVGVGATV